ncbi:MAG: TraC family protein, partial [Burkholderiales bacterium]|nr:TraC family protein [Burkholderiales bacterium]
MPTPFAPTASTRSAASPGGSRPGHGSLGWLGLGSPPDTPAEQFASWLPYSAYLADEKLFVNRDSLGFMLELMPQSGADDRMAEVLISLYSTCPPA